MRTTKKFVSVVLALCMLGSTTAMSAMAATTDAESVSGGSIAIDNAATQALEELDAKYRYNGNDLGATYSKNSTTFKVWSPTATKISVNLYATGSDSEEGAEAQGSYELTFDAETGVWSTILEGDFKNTYYTYTITVKNPTTGVTTTSETQDVYSKAVGVNGNRSMIVDLDSTDPEGWENDTHIFQDEVTDSTVWELHIKDFSYDKSSGVSEANRGKYLAFTEEGTTLNGEGNISTCIDYLKELGVNTVQLNPFYDYQSVNEAGDDEQFNWGYDPQNYNVPEGSYSSNPYDGNVRIKECKEMIQALHDAGISVVMDVVYNHTYSTDSCFQKTVPNYYYRLNKAGTFSNGSGCGNECATERAMYRNYVIQSCLYWVNEYHVDGFRFDLMGIMDVEAMNQIRDALDTVSTKVTMWGEGWTGGDSYHPTNTCDGTVFTPALQGNAAMLSDRIGIFNDVIRDAVKGGAMSIANIGFVQGKKSDAKGISYGIFANSVGNNKWMAKAPSQSVTYADCHDNAALYDQLVASTASGDYGKRYEDLIKMNKVAGSIINTSQGISFMLAGQEMARTKYGDTNSYKSSPEINKINWNNIVEYQDLVSYYKGLFEIRKNFTPFTAMDKSYAPSYTLNQAIGSAFSNQVAFTVKNDQADEWQTMAVIHNAATTAKEVPLKDDSCTEWVIIADGQSAGLKNLGEVSGSTFTVPALTSIIAVDKASFDKLALDDGMGKVTVNYVYEKTGKNLVDPEVIQGTIGTGYVTAENTSIPETYVLSKVEGPVTGKYSSTPAAVTYYYTDYVPESFLNADLTADGVIDVRDVTKMQNVVSNPTGTDADTYNKVDVNYDTKKDVNDVTALQIYISGQPVSSGSITVNHYYTEDDGTLKKLTPSTTISGRVGNDYTTANYRTIGYAVDPERMPVNANGYIPFGVDVSVDYYYVASNKEVKLHVKHNGSLTWNPTLWLWGSDTSGKDSDNYTTLGEWPGDTLTEKDENGWYVKDFTYKKVGSYNVIVSNEGETQTKDYKGFVDNEIWIVIDDSAVDGGSYLTFYTDNPDTNPDAPIAVPIS